MECSSLHRMVLALALGISAVNGCANPRTELDVSANDPSQDHRKIADLYRDEAARLRQKSAEMTARIAVYERLFGPTSDWVAGTRLQADSYEQAAKEQERMATEHLGLVKNRQLSPSVRPEPLQ